MSRKRALLDSDGMPTGNSWTGNNRSDDDGGDGGFRALLSNQDDDCPECGFEGPLRSTSKGYKCPKCRVIVIPSE